MFLLFTNGSAARQRGRTGLLVAEVAAVHHCSVEEANRRFPTDAIQCNLRLRSARWTSRRISCIVVQNVRPAPEFSVLVPGNLGFLHQFSLKKGTLQFCLTSDLDARPATAATASAAAAAAVASDSSGGDDAAHGENGARGCGGGAAGRRMPSIATPWRPRDAAVVAGALGRLRRRRCPEPGPEGEDSGDHNHCHRMRACGTAQPTSLVSIADALGGAGDAVGSVAATVNSVKSRKVAQAAQPVRRGVNQQYLKPGEQTKGGQLTIQAAFRSQCRPNDLAFRGQNDGDGDQAGGGGGDQPMSGTGSKPTSLQGQAQNGSKQNGSSGRIAGNQRSVSITDKEEDNGDINSAAADVLPQHAKDTLCWICAVTPNATWDCTNGSCPVRYCCDCVGCECAGHHVHSSTCRLCV